MENDYRTFADTQIYKEGGVPTAEEYDIIAYYIKNANCYRSFNDEANGYFAISLNEVNQKEDEEWGMTLVALLNESYKERGEDAPWYLGDECEEYVFVD